MADEKEVLGTTVVSYQQTYNGIPVWEAGTSVTMLADPLRVTASTNSAHAGLSVAEDALDGGNYGPDAITPEALKKLLTVTGRRNPTINGTPRNLIYLFEPDRRFDPEAGTPSDAALEAPPPTLPLPRCRTISSPVRTTW